MSAGTALVALGIIAGVVAVYKILTFKKRLFQLFQPEATMGTVDEN